MKNKVIINFHDWRDGDLDTDGQRITLKMSDNPHFLMLTAESAAVAKASGVFHQAYIAARDGGRQAHREKDAARKVLEKALRILGFHINEEADGDLPKLQSTGYP